MIGPVKIISGTAHPELAQDICKYLEIELCRSSVVRLSNENMLVQIEENAARRTRSSSSPPARPSRLTPGPDRAPHPNDPSS